MRSLRRKHTGPDDRVIHQVASWCLGYPDDVLLGRLDLLRAALDEQPPGVQVTLLSGFVHHLGTADPDGLRRDYIDVFDLSRKQTLYLSYWTDGDTRRRGATLGEFKQLYRDSGFLVDLGGELPDHLPIVLEFSARADPRRGREVLEKYRPALELIRLALAERGSRHADVLAAVCATLPGPAPADRESALALRAPIPKESVGLEPFDPRLLPINPT
ncbi:nitrate reductase molybdenum cofactor assembly chaperone [Gordonia sp. ABSL11-1]|uniref:nitrate reductase molybdenum cofactor assembly chaperone n=1 Tax=Gordonia sp. ABSL11-1 TaxID=3053924 RepID=UPI002572405B|nr:nitrate reductase molybdenum cofactor assembly chaperone [Gordonia sp. ABSL11-1]MDL9944934.1 nitrate reductase molybdenum cofactor assembly chaperone [Gordonia sp. ABSL11-1]